MPSSTHDLTVPAAGWGGRRLPGLLPVPAAGAREREEPVLRVTVVGPDAGQRLRLMAALAGSGDVEVVGWADSTQSLDVLGRCSGSCGTGEPVSPEDELVVVLEIQRPHLAPRQREVLAAYAAGNELLDVVARRLGMNPETLKTHLRRIRAKYRDVGRPAPTRRDLYVRAVEDGLLPPPR
jgi:DNA-binding CsgD family transcriptional regulator